MDKKRKVSINLLWRFLERIGAQGVTFIVSIVLARLLEPNVYGVVALVTVFTSILQVFVDSGFGNALIQKKDSDDLDFSTVFYFNIFTCSLLYLVLFLAAPLIAKFYNNLDLTKLVRVLGIIILVSGIKGIQQAYVSKHMMFKRFFFATLAGTIGAGVIGITMAYCGYGVWAVVAQYLFNMIIDTVILWLTVRWRPKLQFSFSRLKALFSFGWKILVSSLINTLYNEMRQLVIGKKYSSEDLAFFNKGQQFPNLIVTNINTSIDSVLLPAMAEEQDDRKRVKLMTQRAIEISSYVMWPIMIGLAVCANSLVKLILTEKWLPCVPFMQIYCITFAFYPIHTANLNAIKAIGRSDLFLRLEIIKKIVGFTTLLVTMWFGVMAMAYSLLFTSVVSQIINSWPNKKLLGYSYVEQIKDIMPNIISSLIMGLPVYFIGLINISPLIILVIQVIIGAFIYIFISIATKNKSFQYIKDSIAGLKGKERI